VNKPYTKPDVSIIIPLYNEEEYIADCLNSLLSLKFPEKRYEIIVIDNGSKDKSCEVVKKFDVKLLSMPDVKVGAVRNYGASLAQGDILVFVDADCTVDDEWLEKGVQELEQYDAVGGLVMLRHNPSWIEKNWVLNSSKSYKYQSTFSGASIFIKKTVFEAVRGFDASLNAGEDSQLTYDLINQGFKIDINPQLNVTHLGYPTTIKEFVNRQKWHAADYAFKFSQIFSDKIFLMVFLYLMCFILLVISVLVMNIYLFICVTFFLLLMPAVLSIKRIIRYGGIRKGHNLASIYLVDCLYLLGRLLGLIVGAFNYLLNRKSKIYKVNN
jgi:glycosyltransferase involved in cell wall biosynthesis